MPNRIISGFIKKHWPKYAAGILFLVLSSYIQTISPRILGYIIDLLRAQQIDTNKVLQNIGILMLVAVAAFGTRYTWRAFIIGNARNLECYLRLKLFEHLQTLSVQFYSNRKTGDLMAYAVNDIGAVRMTFGPGVALLVNGLGIGLISIFTMTNTINSRLTFLALAPIPIILFMLTKIGGMVQRRFKTVQETFGAISDRVQENISGIRVIKSYVQEEAEIQNFDLLNASMMEANLKMVRISSLLSPLIEICFGVSFMVGLIYGSHLVRTGIITLGEFVAFNSYLAMIMRPVISVGRIINIFQRGMASFKRLNKIFVIQPDIVDSDTCKAVDKLEGAVSITNLTFYYPEANVPALEDINIEIQKGQTLGIIGRTGSGKTTLVNLLLRFYNVENGKIFLDSMDINDIPLSVLRQDIGCAPQDNFLFSATIKDNIKFFNNTYSDSEAEAAAQLACIYRSIIDFPEKFDTVVGERGVNLSGGQKQRISLARAIIKNPSILILDDTLSAVDTRTEEEILRNFRELLSRRTSIIIANRVSAIKNADYIIVMDHGRIVERGNHEELMEQRGLYFEICQEQLKEEQRKKVEYEEV